MIERDGLAVRLLHACMEVITSEDELAGLDVAGGHIMVEVASAISSSVAASTGDVLDLFDDAARAVSRLGVSGGTVEFWDAWLEGLAEGAPGSDEMTVDELRSMLSLGRDEVARALESGLGDAAALEVLVAVCDAVAASEDELDLFDDAADAAEGATEGSTSVAAVSAARFLRGLAQA
ncbi:hypothetical protein [Thermophilibacter sp.]|uniref:hypothetical protein n=1 Tax=Thermophilibacter sp. TaxID=2847309 RepID=UPI003A8FA6EB